MTVYVDDMQAPFSPKAEPARVYLLCHMVADSEAELHAMAERIGMERRRYQGDHYDIDMARKHKALALGARQISQRQLACMVWLARRGLAMGAPETAEARYRQHRGSLSAPAAARP